MTLIRGKSPQVDANTPFSIQDTGSFYVIKTPTGITLTWDKGTRVYLKLTTEHRGKVRKTQIDLGLGDLSVPETVHRSQEKGEKSSN
jgi:hypothetical protein